MRKIFPAAVLAILVAFPAVAATAPELLGDFGAWQAYAYDEDGTKVCFMSARPDRQDSSKPNASGIERVWRSGR